ncbi:hypothetical protein [Streptomyces rubradiris]|uniref:DUF4352 domain-containing protein n=1 Tax=Streptomyces rubradiris TaxID=285531 RepID=A0ABQ3REH2_STRRR|nr:hypothetical protein [Streptomyces rubradiris]GHG98454.1 hypothetical protein GCM10018792_11410 [Streptomyces rubradiris]GHI54240.1 hypothetical protein Srubr_40860 [Streptomyces rubradiris]
MSTDFTPPPMPGYGPPVPPPPPPVPPRKSRTALIAVAAAVVAAAVSALVTVGVSGDAEAKPAPTVTVTETAPADGARTDDDAAATDDGEATDSADGGEEDGVYALDDTAVYEPATEVALSGFERAVTGEYAEPENTPYLRFTVKVKNGGKKALDVTQLTVNCSYGKDGESSESVFDSDAGLEGGPETKLLPGRSLNVPWGCELPKGEKLIQIEVSPDFESDAAIFTGTVK